LLGLSTLLGPHFHNSFHPGDFASILIGFIVKDAIFAAAAELSQQPNSNLRAALSGSDHQHHAGRASAQV
jgi:hypothetical protein